MVTTAECLSANEGSIPFVPAFVSANNSGRLREWLSEHTAKVMSPRERGGGSNPPPSFRQIHAAAKDSSSILVN